MKRLILLWLPVLVWMGVIFVVSSQTILPGAQVFSWDFALKKLAHMGEYALLYLLLLRAIGAYETLTKYRYIFAFVIAMLYAITDELHQSFVPGRHAQLMDVGFDTLGIFIAYLRSRSLI